MSVEPEPPNPKPRARGIRARYVVASLLCAGVVAWLLIGGLAANIVYLRPVSYAVQHRAQQGSHTFRMAGQVEPGTIVQTKGGVKFSMTDGKAAAAVDLQGSPPDLFKNCAPVVVEGRWAGSTFLGDRLLIRHGAQYSPKAYKIPDVKDAKCPPAAVS
ncbi:MAG TPA: cytochrome c maturation protein CcmE [Acidimicrobiia bacterium]